MKNTLFIASRLKYRRRIVTVSIAISYIVMIVAMAVSSGFRHEVRNALSQIGGDIQLCPYNLNYMDEAQPVDASPSYLPQIEMVEGVESVVPAIYRAGIVKAGDDIHGVVIKGIESQDTIPLSVSIPRRLAQISSLSVGDKNIINCIDEWWKEECIHRVYFFGDDEAWGTLEQLDDTGIFKVQVPEGKYNKVIICRCKDKDSTWNNKGVYNQTGDINILPYVDYICIFNGEGSKVAGWTT